MPDVFKMLKDLELKAVGLDDKTQKMQEGYFVAFRNIGLPIHKEDYENPWSPSGANVAGNIPKDPVDPKDAPKTGSGAIDTNQAFAANVAKSMQAYLNTYVLVNNKLQMNNQYSVMPGSSKLADTWYAIISGANGIATDMQLDDAQKQKLAEATAKLMDQDGNPTPHYNAYMQAEENYTKKLIERNQAYAAAFTDPMKLQQWGAAGAIYTKAVESAWDRWMGLGFKSEIENAINTLASQGIDPAIALIARAKKKFENSLFDSPGYGLLPYTMLSPRSWYDASNNDGWNQYTSKDFHSESHYTASSTSYGGGGGFNVGLYSASGNFEHADSTSAGNTELKNVQISFDYAIADVDRGWLDTSLLNLNNWFLVGDYQKNCISNGTMNQEKPGDGTEPLFLPSVVTSLILTKNVRISWDDWKTQWSAHKNSNSGSASVGIWCFNANAHYSHATEQRDFSSDDTGEALVIPGIQVIGYVSQIMPPSPQRKSGDTSKKT